MIYMLISMGRKAIVGSFTLLTLALAAFANEPLTPTQESGLKQGDSFKECLRCPVMIVAPAGMFTMGSPVSEQDRNHYFPRSNEGPQHRVTFAKAFAVGRFAVTFDEWDACASQGGCNPISDHGWGRGTRPALMKFNEGVSYVRWLARITGRSYRIPSEAEREYIARAETTTPFWLGGSISTNQANFNGNFVKNASGHWSYDPGRGDFRGGTVPVDAFSANPWGFYQVHGNIYEWVWDCYAPTYSNAPEDGSAYGESCGVSKVVRGGSWLSPPWELRSAARTWYTADGSYRDVGLRVARTIDP